MSIITHAAGVMDLLKVVIENMSTEKEFVNVREGLWENVGNRDPVASKCQYLEIVKLK